MEEVSLDSAKVKVNYQVLWGNSEFRLTASQRGVANGSY